VTQIKAGKSKYNIVCGQAKAKLDLRFLDPKEGELIHKKIIKILSQPTEISRLDKLAAQCTFKIVDDCPPIVPRKNSKIFTNLLRELLKKEEKKEIPMPRNGAAADTCHLSHDDCLVIDGLGPCGYGMHQNCESVLISSLNTRSNAICEFLMHLDKKL
jgi:acetylornithine deacetylase/succinyl-diaminopimelate desuccinylase-like protein